MLNVDKWTYFEGSAEVDGAIVMRFYGQVNYDDPNNILITEKEEFEDSYRKNVAEIRQSRREFEDKVYFESSRLLGLKKMVDFMENGDQPNCVQISDNFNTEEGGIPL